MMKRVEIPLLVISELNVREHWRVGHMRHKGQKFTVTQYLKNNNIPQMTPVTITMIRSAKKKLDSDNLQGAFKYVRDAIAEYFCPGLAAGRADENEDLHWVYKQEVGDGKTIIELNWDFNEQPWLSHKEERMEDYLAKDQ